MLMRSDTTGVWIQGSGMADLSLEGYLVSEDSVEASVRKMEIKVSIKVQELEWD